jgi:hypothetical protein
MITITISGRQGIGKTRLAQLIDDALCDDDHFGCVEIDGEPGSDADGIGSGEPVRIVTENVDEDDAPAADVTVPAIPRGFVRFRCVTCGIVLTDAEKAAGDKCLAHRVVWELNGAKRAVP